MGIVSFTLMRTNEGDAHQGAPTVRGLQAGGPEQGPMAAKSLNDRCRKKPRSRGQIYFASSMPGGFMTKSTSKRKGAVDRGGEACGESGQARPENRGTGREASQTLARSPVFPYETAVAGRHGRALRWPRR